MRLRMIFTAKAVTLNKGLAHCGAFFSCSQNKSVLYLISRDMKFQKGILEDKPAAPAPQPQPQEPTAPVVVEKDRLFQTVKEETGSERNYLKLLGIVVLPARAPPRALD